MFGLFSLEEGGRVKRGTRKENSTWREESLVLDTLSVVNLMLSD